MRVVLLYPAWTGEYGLFGHFAQRNSRWPPLNQGQNGGACEAAGHETYILDAEVMGWKKERLAREALKLKPDVVGLSAYSPFYHLSADVAAEIKRINKDVPIMGGGPHFTITKEKAMLPQFDYGFLGEAEDSLAEFLNVVFAAPKQLHKVRGIMFRENGQIVSTGERWVQTESMTKKELAGLHPLDRFPFPARHLLPMEKYLLGTPKGRQHFTSLQTARGCPWKCLVAGTPILMYNGQYAAIETIKEGDRVVCADLRKGVPSIGTVIKTGNRITKDIYRLTLSDGSQIDATGDHPVWTKTGWRRVEGLQKGQQILSLSNLRDHSSNRQERTSYVRRTGLRQGKNSTGQTWRIESDEEGGNSPSSGSGAQRASWPKIVRFHARKESFGEDVAGRTQEIGEYQTALQNCVQAHDSEQPDAQGGSCGESGSYEKTHARSGAASSTSGERDEQVREAIGQDFSPREIASPIHRLQEVLDRSWSVRQEKKPRFYSYCSEEKIGDSLQRPILAYKGKYRRTQTRLYGTRLDGFAPLGRVPEKGHQTVPKDTGQRFSPRWLRVVDIARLGRGLVYSIAVEPYRNFFANKVLVHNCVFCASDAIKTTRYIMKSPKRVVEEMADIAERFPYIEHIYIVDDVLTFWPEHIVEICERMDAEGLKFTFESSTRANLVDDKLIERLARSGLIRLSFGLETIDPEMRVTMQKKVPLDAYPKANRICSEHGVEAMNSIMIGLPGDTREKTEKLFDWVSQQRDIKQANLAIAIPYPGTEFHEMAISGSHGLELLSEDFSSYLRYGNAVTNVGDMTAQDLIEQQNKGFVKIYSKPWRWAPVWHKHGTLGFLLQMWRVLKLWRKQIVGWSPFRPLMRHPKEM